jgi:hypothetical protein
MNQPKPPSARKMPTMGELVAGLIGSTGDAIAEGTVAAIGSMARHPTVRARALLLHVARRLLESASRPVLVLDAPAEDEADEANRRVAEKVRKLLETELTRPVLWYPRVG